MPDNIAADAVLKGRSLVAGSASGPALVSTEPLSFWGGVDPATGEIIDKRHERAGENVAGRVFVFPEGRGSSTSSATLLESIRVGVAPAAIINRRIDSILALGAIVADELYGRTVPVVLLDESDFLKIHEGDSITIEPNGTISVARDPNTEKASE